MFVEKIENVAYAGTCTASNSFRLSTGSRRHYIGNKLPSLEMKKDDAFVTLGKFLLSKMPAKVGITRVGETWP